MSEKPHQHQEYVNAVRDFVQICHHHKISLDETLTVLRYVRDNINQNGWPISDRDVQHIVDDVLLGRDPATSLEKKEKKREKKRK
jgi:hypothetical protein